MTEIYEIQECSDSFFIVNKSTGETVEKWGIELEVDRAFLEKRIEALTKKYKEQLPDLFE